MNLPTSVHIQVTQEHIDKGVKTHPSQCPVACAILDQIKETITVGPRKVCIRKHWYDLPPEAIEFIYDFDCNGPVSPFEFTLNLTKGTDLTKGSSK